MNLLLFKTNIETSKKVNLVKPILNNHPVISDWSVDTEDIDNVLRIEAFDQLNENDVISFLKFCGFYSEVLSD